MARIIIKACDLLPKDKECLGSCRFCCRGMGLHYVVDEDKNEVFSLCAKHLAVYNNETDSIPFPEPGPEPEPE